MRSPRMNSAVSMAIALKPGGHDYTQLYETIPAKRTQLYETIRAKRTQLYDITSKTTTNQQNVQNYDNTITMRKTMAI